MKGAADRPGDAGRDPGARPGREPESAAFEVVRVRGGSRWSPFVAAAVAAVLIGMVGIAVGSRLSAVPPSPPPVAAVATAPTGLATEPSPLPTLLDLRVPVIPVQTSDPGSTQIRLAVQRQQSGMFVHGDVYVAKVTWVFVSLRDPSGTVTGWASVSVPGAAGPGLRDGPTMRFDVQLAVPADYTGALTIQATAYDGTGHVVGSTQLLTPEEPTP